MSLLQLRNVSKSYRSGDTLVRALDGATLDVGEGEVVAIIGPSGSGKTSLLHVAAGMMQPDAGEVFFDGEDISTLDDDEGADHLRRNIGFVFQGFHLLQGVSALDNAAFKLLADRVPTREGRRLAGPWLERMGLEHRMNHTPEQLSGGERQRVAIARALVNDPRLLLADEPTASLDSETGKRVLEALTDACHDRGAAAIVVTHDVAVAALADRVHELRDGRVLATSGSSPPRPDAVP